MIESASGGAGAEIGREKTRSIIILHQKSDRDAAMGLPLLDHVEPLPAWNRLAAIDPFNEDEGRVGEFFHVA